MIDETTPVVRAIGSLRFSCNVDGQHWYTHITNSAGRPDFPAIALLGEILRWYRPARVTNDRGELVRKSNRFKADKLQLSHKHIRTRLGMSKKQSMRALKVLRDLGLITTELRTEARGSAILHNVMYIEPVPEAIAAISLHPAPPATDQPPVDVLSEGHAMGDTQTVRQVTIDDAPRGPVESTAEVTTYVARKTARQPASNRPCPPPGHVCMVLGKHGNMGQPNGTRCPYPDGPR